MMDCGAALSLICPDRPIEPKSSDSCSEAHWPAGRRIQSVPHLMLKPPSLSVRYRTQGLGRVAMKTMRPPCLGSDQRSITRPPWRRDWACPFTPKSPNTMTPKTNRQAWDNCNPKGVGLTLSSNASTTSDGTKPNTIISAIIKTGCSAPEGLVWAKPETTLMMAWPNSTAEAKDNSGDWMIACSDLPTLTLTIEITTGEVR
jgi:hypothetical protein